MRRYAGYLLLSDPEAFSQYQQRLPSSLEEPPVSVLARAIATSPGWPDGCGAVLVARTASNPTLTVLGRFDAAGEAWLRCQSRALLHACAHLRYVDDSQVRQDCVRLADRLREQLGDGLSRAKLAAIPRGGLVVLGLLAAILGVDREQLEPPFPEERPLIVVDDCALSGTRFSQFLRGRGSSRVVFAPLYSHPELRAAIEAREPRVESVLSAADIQGERLDRGGARPDGEGYWAGTTEALAFPWNEPERSVWNPAAERWEAAWHIVPPELCLKNRPRPGSEPIPIQVHPAP